MRVGIALFILLASGQAWANDAICPNCNKQFDEYQKLRSEDRRLKEILAKNQQKLGQLNPSQTSLITKIKSNMLIANVRIETNRNRLEFVLTQLKQERCESVCSIHVVE